MMVMIPLAHQLLMITALRARHMAIMPLTGIATTDISWNMVDARSVTREASALVPRTPGPRRIVAAAPSTTPSGGRAKWKSVWRSRYTNEETMH